MRPSFRISPSLAELSVECTNAISDYLAEAISLRGIASLVLAGGLTPREVYRLLSASNTIEWQKVHLFWGDERCVPPDHQESNYLMVRQSLLDKISIPEENVHRIKAEEEPAQAAALYNNEVSVWLNKYASFDVTLLGIGDDGHTASLFPETSALRERSVFVMENWVPKFNTYRITLTYPAINRSNHIIFLVAGGSKADILHQIIDLSEPFPASLVQSVHGSVEWFMDNEAGKKLEQNK